MLEKIMLTQGSLKKKVLAYVVSRKSQKLTILRFQAYEEVHQTSNRPLCRMW
jgi:hypothetical protein